MIASQNADVLLKELEQVRKVVLDLRNELKQLQSLPRVQAAYDAELGQETKLKQTLEQQILALKAEKSRLQGSNNQVKPRPIITQRINRSSQSQDNNSSNMPVQPATSRLLPKEERLARRELEYVRRFASRLGAQDNLELINMILNDPGQPRGAVLFLVNWEAFTKPLPNEMTSQEKYFDRLKESIAALLEYQEQIQADIAMLKIQYGGLLGVWEVWCKKESDPQRWTEEIEQTRADQRCEIAKLQQQKTSLEDEIADLRA